MKRIMMAMAGMLLMAASPEQADIDDLGWMSGRWESLSGDFWVEEIWSAPRGGTMVAVSRTGEADTLRAFEYIRLQRGQDGRLAYIASPNGGPAVAFSLVEMGAASATFANPAHDFPQLIRYEREDEAMRATISASDGSNSMTWTFRRLP